MSDWSSDVCSSDLRTASSPSAKKKPNIIILLADQLRAQALGYAGDGNVRTPHIDSLAAQSANFRYAISNLPVCTPYRASLLTGQRPLTNGIFMNDVRLDTGAVTIAEVLSENGYQTAYIGKWHLDGQYRLAFTPPISEERRVGKECVDTFRSRWAPAI